MTTSTNNLLIKLHKWVHRQDENFQTEAFAHLLRHLIEQEPQAAVRLLRLLTGGLFQLNCGQAGKVSIETQVTTAQGRPDMAIRSPHHLVYVEAKVESGLGPGQLEGYRKELKASGVPSTALVVITRYPIVLLPTPGYPNDVLVRWYHIADWLGQLSLESPVGIYLGEQFISFLRARNMSVEKVSWELVNGGPALHNLLSMVYEVTTGLGLKPNPFSVSMPSFGCYADEKRYWIGVDLTAPHILVAQTYKLLVDKEQAKSTGLADGVFPSKWPKETLGEYRWGRQVDLGSEEVHFFARSKASQMQFLEQFFKGFVEAVKKVEGK